MGYIFQTMQTIGSFFSLLAAHCSSIPGRVAVGDFHKECAVCRSIIKKLHNIQVIQMAVVSMLIIVSVSWCLTINNNINNVLHLTWKKIRLVAACIVVIYLAIMYGTYVPDWEFTVHSADNQDTGKLLQVSLF